MSEILAFQESCPQNQNFCCLPEALSMKEADLRDMFEKASKGVCRSTVMVSPYPVSSTSSAV
jgi:hypothetical protein